MPNYRVIYQKKTPFQTQQAAIQQEIDEVLQIPVRIRRVLYVYDIFNCSEPLFQQLKQQVLLDQVTDVEITDFDGTTNTFLASEYLPGQFDVRADSALQCLQLLSTEATDTQITSGTIIEFDAASTEQYEILSSYLINPVEKREKDLVKPLSISESREPQPVKQLLGFRHFDSTEITEFRQSQGLAMSDADLLFIQSYFKGEEKRDPTETEIKVLDTYWSDHCRHTTFLTELTDIDFEDGTYSPAMKRAYTHYLQTRDSVLGQKITSKPICLMDLATLAAKDLKKRGILTTVEESEEINACSVYQTVKTADGEEQWLLMFKNETHNHPTEIEPFGGASTCLGGCIRDPLSGRAYVYQAMRVTGAANPLEPLQDTLSGKLPQKLITSKAADGFSSYGNQIGLATTHVTEVYHPGYQAKRMEVGAVVAAVPASWVRRESPLPGDAILLLGGKTGRDGVGGATGSSKEHTEESLESAGAEVQKGNPPEERKIQRLFRNPEVTTLIKKCNDFGAGGVSVAIGELADGLRINLDRVRTKYQGLNGTELALSESQERMAVVIDRADIDTFQALASVENLVATHVADVPDSNRLVMEFRGQAIVDISREFLDTNGVRQQASVLVSEPQQDHFFTSSTHSSSQEALLSKLATLNTASQQGLAEQFDSTIGSTTVQMPFGGVYQKTPAEASVQTFPTLLAESLTASAMAWGFNPQLSSWSPFHGGSYAVVESLTKLACIGANVNNAYFSFQEYFRKLGNDPKNWGLPFAALLGAFEAQQQFECAAIGGKDSMSGTFQDIHVPPTLISFAVASLDVEHTISNELKTTESYLYLLKHIRMPDHTPNYAMLRENFDWLHTQIQHERIISAGSVGSDGIAAKLAVMAFGNRIGFSINTTEDLFATGFGSILIESREELAFENVYLIGQTDGSNQFTFHEDEILIDKALATWENTLEPIFPTKTVVDEIAFIPSSQTANSTPTPKKNVPKPRVFIPAFPGTNCEYDSQRAFEDVGAKTFVSVFRNEKPSWIEESITNFVSHVEQSQILMLSGGFSAGDEPDGSGKFISAVLRNERVRDAVHELLERDGLILGICNGFQALVKCGLLPFGKIATMQEKWPTLSHNEIGRHISQIVRTKVVSNHSPWLQSFESGEEHQIAISHGEGRFMVQPELANQLFATGQIATQYIDFDGNATMQRPFNPNGSMHAIESITSSNGRIFGKMGHSERMGKHLYKNIPGKVGQDIFKNGVEYFT